LEQRYCDMALAIQQVTEEIVLKLAKEAKRLTGSENICLAGGVALNCVANGKLHEAGIFKRIFIQPAAGDAGGALGAALAANYIYFGGERILGEQRLMEEEETPAGGKEGVGLQQEMDALQGGYLGPAFTEKEIVGMAVKLGAKYSKTEGPEALVATTARLLSEGKVVGWFQGRMEFGPRALGARSILGDARDPDMQRKLNISIKNREGFRPFAPAVPAEEVGEYFETGSAALGEGGSEAPGGEAFVSPYMLMVKGVKRSRRCALPPDYSGWSMEDKLRFVRSDLPAITHIDYSARIQTVHRETNPLFWALLRSFRELTGCAVLINTSFNVRDEPIVHTPEEAYRCFIQTEMDCLVMGDLIFYKNDYLAGKR
jgi:carbamoyltransferase